MQWRYFAYSLLPQILRPYWTWIILLLFSEIYKQSWHAHHRCFCDDKPSMYIPAFLYRYSGNLLPVNLASPGALSGANPLEELRRADDNNYYEVNHSSHSDCHQKFCC